MKEYKFTIQFTFQGIGKNKEETTRRYVKESKGI